MKHLDFTLKIITPAFVAGAQSENVPGQFDRDGNPVKRLVIGPNGDGLRIPSLRGILRFWFRSLHANKSPKELKELEAKFLGSDSTGQGLRIIPVKCKSFETWKPTKVEGEPASAEGYLGYRPILYNRDIRKSSSHNLQSYRDAIPPDSRFKFKAIGTADQIEDLKNVLRLIHLFGGIGSRSRRAFGSLAVDGDGIFENVDNGLTPEEWFRKHLAQIDFPPLLNKKDKPRWTAFSELTKIRLISYEKTEYYEDYGIIWDMIYERFEETRLWRVPQGTTRHTIATNDHNWEETAAGCSRIGNVPLRLAYGLPYQPSSRRYNWSISYFGGRKKENHAIVEETDRRASPLLFKIMEPYKGNFMGVVLFLRSDYFGDNTLKVGAKTRNRKKHNLQAFPGYAAIDKFLHNPSWIDIIFPLKKRGDT